MLGRANAAASSSASVIDGATSKRSLIFPLICTTTVTASATSNFSSTAGQPASATHGLWPRRSHISSAVNGATSDNMIAIASTASRTAGSAEPQPESIALRVAFTNSITRATATLKRKDSTAKPASCNAL